MNDFSISVIIPTLNEAENIESLLRYLRQLDQRLELIVVDAHSQDHTAVLAAKLSRVIQSPPGRGIQMNHGARVAKGDIFWFLHADCRPHRDSIQAMKRALSDQAVVGGGFEYNLDHPGFFFRLVEFLSNRKKSAA
jgi:glycosyltransferase involved in cell wall biosynthesis